MQKKLLLITLLCFGLAVFLGYANAQDAATTSETINTRISTITFPIAELGGCSDETSCRTYCQDVSHFEACMAFAASHNLLSDEKIRKGREELSNRKDKFQEIIESSGGPGGCKTKEECKQYCQDVAHITECADFAKEHGFVSPERALKIKKEFGMGPGDCRSMVECRQYCEDPTHQEECLRFAKKHELMDKDDLEKAEMLIKDGGPGGCKTKDECQAYCTDHEDECLAFAKERGLITKEREDHVKTPENIHKILEENGGPGGCKTQVECKDYCTNLNHTEECMAFAAAHGQMSEHKARAILHRFTEGMLQREENADGLDRIKDERFEKFEEFRQLEKTFRQKNSSDEEPTFSGPGGCTSATACIKYCSENKETCFKRMPMSSNAEDTAESFKTDVLKIRTDLIKPLTPSQKEMMQKRMMQLKEGVQYLPSREREMEKREDLCKLHPEQCKPTTINTKEILELGASNADASNFRENSEVGPAPGEVLPPDDPNDQSGFLPNFKKTIIGGFLFSVLDALLLIK